MNQRRTQIAFRRIFSDWIVWRHLRRKHDRQHDQNQADAASHSDAVSDELEDQQFVQAGRTITAWQLLHEQGLLIANSRIDEGIDDIDDQIDKYKGGGDQKSPRLESWDNRGC